MITIEKVKHWLGDACPYEILAEIANGKYTPEQLADDINCLSDDDE